MSLELLTMNDHIDITVPTNDGETVMGATLFVRMDFEEDFDGGVLRHVVDKHGLHHYEFCFINKGEMVSNGRVRKQDRAAVYQTMTNTQTNLLKGGALVSRSAGSLPSNLCGDRHHKAVVADMSAWDDADQKGWLE